jgi:hypothetical protein
MMLTQEQIDEFIQNGVLVVPSVLSQLEIEETRQGFHQTLLEYGIDINNLAETGHALSALSSTNGSGGVIDLFYYPWKLKLQENERVIGILQEIIFSTYSTYDSSSQPTTPSSSSSLQPTTSASSTSTNLSEHLFHHPFGSFNPFHGYMAIDRVCFRLPEELSQELGAEKKGGKNKKYGLQRSLTPHLDCCPHNRFDEKIRWKPIQCFIALTDALEPNHGGFEACVGFHKELDEWAKTRSIPSSSSSSTSASTVRSDPLDQLCVGQYTAIRSKEESSIISRMKHIPYHAGDMIIWDYRIPHGNAQRNDSSFPREVVYIGLLPDIPMNQAYTKDLYERYCQGTLPIGFWHKSDTKQLCHYEFSELGRKLLTIDTWS